ncbi:unnamed protein product [Orchesella dallaii]|uniref:Bromo domain-containing protein n=1 Tax=Orchesella dallaii TaxID=48710 RepID=A0ABP1PYD3_9HEXA
MRDKTLNDEEDNMEFRRNSLNLLNQISKHECAVEIQKYLTDVESNLLKNPMDFQTIRRKIETGATKTFTTIQKDLSRLLCNAIIANAASDKIGELAVAVMAVYKKEEKKIRESARKRASPRKKIIVPVVCEYEFVHLAATEQLKHLFVDSKAPSKMGVNNEEGTISNIPVSQELTDLVHSALEGTKEDEKVKSPTSTPPAPALAKLLELPVITPGMPLPEISSVKPNDISPLKNATRPTTRGRSKDRTVKESPNDEIIVPIVQEVPSAKKEENDTTVTNAAPASLATSKIETNGGESETLIVAVADEATSDKIEKTPDEKNDNKSQDEKNEEGETKIVDDETTDINHCKSPTTNAHFNDVNAVLVQPSVDSQTQIRYNENVTPTSGEQAETPWQTFNPETPSVIPNVVLPEEKKVKECESSRTSPENTKVKSNQEVVPEAKPRLRVYSGRLPSPISHFEEFPDFGDKEEDPELAAIENNVNKNDSSSPITSTKKIVMRFTRVSKSNYRTFTGKLMPEYKCEFVDQENKNEQPKVSGGRRKRQRSVSETSVADVFPLENKSRVTRSSYQQVNKKSKHRFSPDIVSATKTKSGMNFKIHGLAGKAKSRLVKQLRTRVPRVSLLRM